MQFTILKTICTGTSIVNHNCNKEKLPGIFLSASSATEMKNKPSPNLCLHEIPLQSERKEQLQARDVLSGDFFEAAFPIAGRIKRLVLRTFEHRTAQVNARQASCWSSPRSVQFLFCQLTCYCQIRVDFRLIICFLPAMNCLKFNLVAVAILIINVVTAMKFQVIFLQ